MTIEPRDMLTGVHFLLTYSCTMQCDHCFLYCGPFAVGAMTIGQVTQVLDECRKLGGVTDVFFEGGEPFLHYATMLEGIRRASAVGFRCGIVTNAYWATSDEDAELWLRALADAGLSSLSISADELHGTEVGSRQSEIGSAPETPNLTPQTRPQHALAAAQLVGISAHTIAISRPCVERDESQEKGAPQIGGTTRLRGRAAEKLTAGLPTRTSASFTDCPYEDLADPKRVHVDAFGNVLVCQGISIGNCLTAPFSKIVAGYDPQAHAIVGPLLRGGPAALAAEHALSIPEAIDECHLCYLARLALLDRLPDSLAPRQAYGL